MWSWVLPTIKWALKTFGIYAVGAGYNKYQQDKERRNNRSIVYKNDPVNENIDREQPVPIVYGKCRVPGMLIYQEDTEVQNDSYDAAFAFCEGEVESVDNIEINNVPIGDISTATATTYTGTATQTGDTIFTSGLFRVFAKQDAYTSEANPTTNYSTTDPNYLRLKGANVDDKRIYLQFDLSAYPPGLTLSSAMIVMWGWDFILAGRVAAYVGGDETMNEDTITWNTQPSTGALASDYPNLTKDRSYQLLKFNSAGLAFLQTQYNAATTATFVIQPYVNHMGEISYTSKESPNPTPYLIMRYTGGTACGYRNMAYAAVHLDPSHDKIGSANPTVIALVQGRKIKNWTGSAYQTTYVRNPAWQVYDFLTNTRYGAGITETDLDDATFKTVASYCDAEITDDDGNTIPRYTSNVVIDGGSDGWDGLNMILRSFGGFLFTNNGKICLGVEKTGTSSFAFTESNIIAGSFQYAEIDRAEAPNVVRAMFIDAENKYQKTVVQIEDEPDQDERGSVIQDIDLLGVDSRNQTTRITRIQLMKAKLCRYVCSLGVSIKNCDVAVGDICTVTHSVPNWTAKPFRIVKLEEYQNDEITLTLEEYNDSFFDDGGQGATYTEYPSLPNPVTIRTPSEIPETHRIVWSTASKAIWTQGTIYYKGIGYEIEAGETTNAYIYFDPDISTTALQTSAARPTINANTWVLAYYDSVGDDVYPARSEKVLHAGLLQANSITTSELSFTPATSTNVIATINASAEGLRIEADNIAISGSTDFSAGYNPTSKVDEVGGTYDSAASGARVRIFPDANTGIQVIDDAAADVFKVIVGGTDVGDVVMGSESGGKFSKWDKSAGAFTVQGLIRTAATGKRAVLDNVNNKFSFFDASGNEIVTIDTGISGSTPGIKITDSTNGCIIELYKNANNYSDLLENQCVINTNSQTEEVFLATRNCSADAGMANFGAQIGAGFTGYFFSGTLIGTGINFYVTQAGAAYFADNITLAAGKTVDGVDISAHAGAGGAVHAVATQSVAGFESAGDKTKLDGIATGAQPGTVTSVTGTAPVASSGGTTPAISMAAATSGNAGHMTAAYASKLNDIAAGATVGATWSVNITNQPSTFTPAAHNLVDPASKHPVSGLTPGHFLKADGAESYGFAAHGLTYSSVGAAAASHTHFQNQVTSGDPGDDEGKVLVCRSGVGQWETP